MKTKGKFYIWGNFAASQNHYWSQPWQNWTTNPRDATFFDHAADAVVEARYAAKQNDAPQVFVRSADRDLPEAVGGAAGGKAQHRD